MEKGIPFEGWAIGQRFSTRGRTVTDSDILSFVATVGYAENLFLDMEYIRERGHTRRMVPALLTASIADGLIIQTRKLDGYAAALLGIDGLTAREPVYAGDTIRVEIEVAGVRASNSRPDRGIVASLQTVKNQEGETVLVYTVKRMVLREKFA